MNAAERLGVFLGTLTLLGLVLGVLYVPADRWLLDAFHQARWARPPVHDSLIVVAIDQKFGEQSGFTEVTPRDYLARLITTLTDEGARAIALDIIIPADDSTEAFDALVAAVERAPSVVFPTSLQPYGLRSRNDPVYELVMEPPPRLRERARRGYVTFFGGARPEMKVLTKLTRDSYRRPGTALLQRSFALEAVAAFYDDRLPPAPDSEGRWTTLLDRLQYPLDASSGTIDAGRQSRRINYTGPVEPGSEFRYISSEDLLRTGGLGPTLFDGKLVLIGATYPGQDLHETPWGPMHGLEIHANLINSLLTKTYLRSHRGWGMTSIAVIFALLPALLASLIYWMNAHRWWTLLLSVLVFLTATGFLLVSTFSLFNRPSGILLSTGWMLKAWVLGTLAGGTAIAVFGPSESNQDSEGASLPENEEEKSLLETRSAVTPERLWRWQSTLLGALVGVVVARLWWKR